MIDGWSLENEVGNRWNHPRIIDPNSWRSVASSSPTSAAGSVTAALEARVASAGGHGVASWVGLESRQVASGRLQAGASTSSLGVSGSERPTMDPGDGLLRVGSERLDGGWLQQLQAGPGGRHWWLLLQQMH
jgi:hypothetical protein